MKKAKHEDLIMKFSKQTQIAPEQKLTKYRKKKKIKFDEKKFPKVDLTTIGYFDISKS